MKNLMAFLFLMGLMLILISIMTGLNATLGWNLGLEGEVLPKDWFSAIAFLVLGLCVGVPGYLFSNKRTSSWMKKSKLRAASIMIGFYMVLGIGISTLIFLEVEKDSILEAIKNKNQAKLEAYFSENNENQEFKQRAFIYAIRQKNLAAVQFLLNNGADPHALTPEEFNGGTIIAFAVRQSSPEVVKLLLERDVNLEFRDRLRAGNLINQTAYGYTTEEDKIGIIKALMKAGLDVYDKDHNQRTALFYAAEKIQPKLVQFLMNSGLGLHDKDEYGNLPIHHVIDTYHKNSSDKMAIVKFLVQSSSPLDIKNNAGRTPSDLAKRRNLPEIADFLKSRE